MAHELMSFVAIDLEDHKILAGGKTRDVDIIIRPLNLIIEYDSHHWHKENTEAGQDKDPGSSGRRLESSSRTRRAAGSDFSVGCLRP